jgi:DNA-directed RNA polymerase-3 subunit RPC5
MDQQVPHRAGDPPDSLQVLVGASAAARTGRYAVGVLNDNELHLTALEGVLAIRPSLGYLDRSDTRARAEGRAAADPDDPVDGTAGEVKPEAVTVKFARGDPERNKKYKEKSYEHHQKMQAEEAWVEARFHQMKVEL